MNAQPMVTPVPRALWESSSRTIDERLAREVARMMHISLPLDGQSDDWVLETFTDSAAMILWLAACDLIRQRHVDDAFALTRDACGAQTRSRPTGRFVATIRYEGDEATVITSRIEILEPIPVDLDLDDDDLTTEEVIAAQ